MFPLGTMLGAMLSTIPVPSLRRVAFAAVLVGPAVLTIAALTVPRSQIGHRLIDDPRLSKDEDIANVFKAVGEKFGKLNLIEAAEVATSAILTNYLPAWGFTITKPIAAALLTGIITDTTSVVALRRAIGEASRLVDAPDRAAGSRRAATCVGVRAQCAGQAQALRQCSCALASDSPSRTAPAQNHRRIKECDPLRQALPQERSVHFPAPFDQ